MTSLQRVLIAAGILLGGAGTSAEAGHVGGAAVATTRFVAATPHQSAAAARAGTNSGGRLAFHYTNANATLTRNGTRLSSTGADVVATGFARKPVTGRAYVEAVVFHAGRHAAGVSLWGDPVDKLGDGAHPGRAHGAAGASTQAVSAWSVVAYANYGLPRDTKVEVGPLSGAPGQRIVVQMAVDATTRAAWVKLATAPGWTGGGDPAAGTRPTFILEGTGPILVGGNASNPANYVEILAADRQVGPVPAGFTPYG